MSSMPEHSSGKYLLRYSNDMKSIQLYLTKGVMEGIRSTLFMVMGLLMLFRIHWGLTLTLLALISGVMLMMYFFAGRQTGFIRTSRSARSSLLAYVSRQFSRFRKLKERQLERVSVAGFKEKSGSLYEANMKYNKTESIIYASVPVLIFAITGVVLWSMVFLKGAISASEGLMFVLILLMMEGGMRQLLKVPTYINKGKISLYKIDKLILEPGPIHKTNPDILLKAS
jgi:ABC-type bacteriocin/lantibiotic exporter with double-glycine peptidase domain